MSPERRRERDPPSSVPTARPIRPAPISRSHSAAPRRGLASSRCHDRPVETKGCPEIIDAGDDSVFGVVRGCILDLTMFGGPGDAFGQLITDRLFRAELRDVSLHL